MLGAEGGEGCKSTDTSGGEADWGGLDYCVFTHDYTSLIDNHEYYYQNLHALTGVVLNSSCVDLFFCL